MTKLQELKQELEQAVKDRDAEWNDGKITQEWINARNKVEDLNTTIHEMELKNAPKPEPMPAWQVAQLDMDWDED